MQKTPETTLAELMLKYSKRKQESKWGREP